MQIESDQIASAIFAGFANNEYVQGFMGLINNAVVKVADFVAGIGRWLSQNLPGFDFFRRWFNDDPVGATAGALLGVVVLVVAGSQVGALGGIATLVKGIIGSKLTQLFGMVTLGWLVGNTIRLAIRGTQFLWNFNWNVTDAQLRTQQQAIFDAMAGQLGGTAGSWLASLLCGVAPVELAKRTKQVRVRPDILARLNEISEGDLWGDDPPEIFEEAVEQLKGLLLVSGMQLTRVAFMESYKNIRKWIRNSANAAGLAEIWPGLATTLEKWGQEGSNSWSFAEKYEEAVENIDNNALRNFTEEFFDELMDQCSENLMIVSYAFG